jgi:tRNA modification GTPase
LAKIQRNDDTIAAIATPIGEGAIAVIRVSGPRAIDAVDKLFVGKSKLRDAGGYTVHLGRLFGGASEVDEVLATIFRNPNSYTGEDTVEVSCHGGMFVTQKALETILATGVRQAEPGEFTKRAFLNGKMDLSQAEAVADLIASRSESAHRASLNQLEGRFSEQIKLIRTELLNLSSLIELELDFSEEGIDLLEKKELVSKIQSLKSKLQTMADTFRVGRVYRDGVSVVIVGKPNAGKSSLFNALLREHRAIVTEIPGTTRDSLEESIVIDGVLFKLSDTAGLRETHDPVESEGVRRAQQLFEKADLFLLVHDYSSGHERAAALHFLDGLRIPSKGILVNSKIDLCSNGKCERRSFNFADVEIDEAFVSVTEKVGLNELRHQMLELSIGRVSESVPAQVSSVRHHAALIQAILSLSAAASSVEESLSGEFVSEDIHSAANALSEITGEITSHDTLNNIFSHFCIGK